MNMAYLLEQPADRFVDLARHYFQQQSVFGENWPDAAYFREVVLLSQPKIKGLEELPAYTRYFFTDEFPVDAKARDKIMSKGEPKVRVRELRDTYANADFSSEAELEKALMMLAAAHGLGVGDYIHPGRLAVSGTNVGPSFYGLFRVLGRERVLSRLDKFLAA